jgi:hypothetical protein
MLIPAAVVLYMIISTSIRILTQDLMFRTGISNPQKYTLEKDRKELAKHPDEAPGKIAKVEEVEAAKPSNGTEPSVQPNKFAPQRKPAQKPSVSKASTVKPQTQSRSKAKRKRKAR